MKTERPMTRAWQAGPAVRLVALVIAAATMTAASATAQLSGSGWPQFRQNTTHTGENLAETKLSPTTVLDLEEAWTFTTGGLVTASPAVVGGVLYVPSGDGRVYALNARTGAFIWQSAAIEAGYPSPAVVLGRVFVATGVDFCRLYALSAATGAVLWSTPVLGGGMTSPAVSRGRVYVGAGGNLYALDAATGASVWTAPLPGMQFSSPAVADGRIYVGAGPKLYALNADTGAVIWAANAGSPSAAVWSSPAVVGGRVYVGSNDFGAPNTYAFDANTGQQQWVAYNPFMVTLSSPAVANGLVYIGSNDSVFTAHDANTGAIVWRRNIQSYNSSPAVANGVVYAGGGLGLFVLDAATGATLKTFDVGFAYYSSPVVVNGMLYVGSFNNKLYAFGLPD